MKWLILFLVSFNLYANYVADTSSKQIFIKKSACENFYKAKCSKIGNNSNLEVMSKKDQMIDDLENPNWGARSMIAPCEGEADCIEKALALQCTEGRHSLYNVEYSEIWCNRIVDYQKKPTGKKLIVEDATKKSIYLAGLQAKKDAENLEHSKIMILKTKLQSGDLTAVEINKALKFLLRKIK